MTSTLRDGLARVLYNASEHGDDVFYAEEWYPLADAVLAFIAAQGQLDPTHVLIEQAKQTRAETDQ